MCAAAPFPEVARSAPRFPSLSLKAYSQTMSDTSLNERITRLLAYMLRHQPDDFDVELDGSGFGDVDDVVHALTERTGDEITLEDLESAITAGGRQRYEIVKGRIRALYGHSIEIDPGESAEPPEDLFLGLAARDRDRMERFGLRGGRRRFLHLSLTEAEAQETGARLAEEYIVVKVGATDAWEQGVDFYDRKSMWLAAELPSYSLEVIGEYDDGTEPERRERGGGDRGRGGDRERGRGRGRRDEGERSESKRGRRGGRGRGRRDDERDERPKRDDERPKREERGEREERPKRQERDERPKREERPQREERSERPKREERPKPEPRAAAPAKGPASTFGAGVVPTPEPERKAEKPAPAPAPKPERKPEPETPKAPAQESSGGFGAGI